MNRRIVAASFLVFLAFMFFLASVFPGVNEFDVWHMRVAILTEQNGSVDPTYAMPAFASLTVMLSELTGLRISELPMLPIQLVPLVLLLLVFFGRVSKNVPLTFFTILAFLTMSTDSSKFTWVAHSLAFLVFLLLAFSCLIRIQNGAGRRWMSDVVVLLSMVSLNFISYKVTFLGLVFLAALTVLQYINSPSSSTLSRSATIRSGFGGLLVIALTFTLAYNRYVYDNFIPIARLSSEYSSSWGIEKLLSSISPNVNDPLSGYYIASSPIDVVGHFAFLLVVATILLTAAGRITTIVVRHWSISSADKVLLAVAIGGTFVFVLYNSLGTPEMGFIIFSAFLAVLLLFAHPSTRVRVLAVSCVAIMLALNVVVNYDTIALDSLSNEEEQAGYQYITYPRDWYLSHGVVPETAVFRTDVLTYGYMMMESAELGSVQSIRLDVLTRDDIMFILSVAGNTTNIDACCGYIINYREDMVSIMGWESFKPWSHSRDFLNANSEIDVVYSSGSTDILLVVACS